MMKRAGTDGEVFAEVAGHRLTPAGDDPLRQWRQYETTFTTGPNDSGLFLVALHNSGTQPAWFDEVSVEELR